MPGTAMERFGLGSGGGEAFQRGRMIGAAQSPTSPIAQAMRMALDKYNGITQANQTTNNQMLLDNNRIGQEYEQKKSMWGADGGVVDMTQGVEIPDGYVGFPEFTVDSTRGRVIKTMKALKAKSIDDQITEKYALENGDEGNIIQQAAGSPVVGKSMPTTAKKLQSFRTPEEADASGLPQGTVVDVGGRRYAI